MTIWTFRILVLGLTALFAAWVYRVAHFAYRQGLGAEFGRSGDHAAAVNAGILHSALTVFFYCGVFTAVVSAIRVGFGSRFKSALFWISILLVPTSIALGITMAQMNNYPLLVGSASIAVFWYLAQLFLFVTIAFGLRGLIGLLLKFKPE